MHDETARIAPRLQAILADRARPDEPAYTPKILSPTAFTALRAVLALVVPHAIDGLDLAQRMDREFAKGDDNGWRFETLPPDASAMVAALASLDMAAEPFGSASFAELSQEAQQNLLTSVADGGFAVPRADALTPQQMRDWFEDLRSNAIRLYVAHPAAIASIGYEGHANGAASGGAFEGWSDPEIGGAA